MNLNRGYLFRGKCFRSLIVFNCLFDHTYYISSTVQPNLAWISLSCTQTAIDEAARTVARDTLQRRAQLHNLRIVEKGGDGHCLEYSVQDQLRQQGIDGQTMQVLRPALASFIEDKAEYSRGFSLTRRASLTRGEGSSTTFGTRMAMRGAGGVIWRFLLCLACFNAIFNTSPLAKVMHMRGLS